ncbi:MAG: hypothetical protein JWN44_167 [Myxococcales bacterium]|nr:hypothetical protein [Myxococcales bacterium]
MQWLGRLLAALALVAGVSACGSTIAVPDQGVIVTGCQKPGLCYRNDCPCSRATLSTPACVIDSVCTDPLDQTTCNCPVVIEVDGGNAATSRCLETAQACVGRGPVCAGVGASCVAPGAGCVSGGTPPMLVSGIGATLEPRCQLVDDVCCPGVDGGVSTD